MIDLNKVNGDQLSAEEYMHALNELENLITQRGIGLSGADPQQVSRALNNAVGSDDFYTEGGSANSYVLSPISPRPGPSTYSQGMRIRFLASANNTGGAMTININSLGAVPLVLETGAALVGGEVSTALMTEAFYDSGSFRIVSPSGQVGPNPTLTNSKAAMTTGGTDPDSDPHLAYGVDTIQSKADGTNSADLKIQPLGLSSITIGNESSNNIKVIPGPGGVTILSDSDGASAVRTTLRASGGGQAYNGKTGLGFERMLTESDRQVFVTPSDFTVTPDSTDIGIPGWDSISQVDSGDYRLSIDMYISANDSGGAVSDPLGIKLQAGANINDFHFYTSVITSAGNSLDDDSGTGNPNPTISECGSVSTSALRGVRISGEFTLTTSASIALEARKSSSSIATIIRKGSKLTLERLPNV